MVLNERPLKKIKRTISGDLNDFLTFPSPGETCFSDGPFRSNIRCFLMKNARAALAPSLFPCLLTYQMFFKAGDVLDGSSSSSTHVVVLDIVEEDVTRSRTVYCDQCRVVGWSNHPVCSKRYHFIIRAEATPFDGYQKPCSRCGDLLQLFDNRCKSCNSEITVEDIEDWIYHQFEDATHLLHGVVHSNGYGHLLTVNGKEGGSKLLTGFDIMNFWDRLCQCLAVRKVSVMDVSRKYGTEYRLLHAVANGCSWYGEWGYEFGVGSYALTVSAYRDAVNSLANIPLSILHQHQPIIAFYQTLSGSKLLTLRDLFSFLLKLLQREKKRSRASPKANKQSMWDETETDHVKQSMVKVLRAAGGWVSRRALKGAVCKIASQELLNHSLASLRNMYAPGGMVVLARFNRALSSMEYKLEPRASAISDEIQFPSVEHIIDDLKLLYYAVFEPRSNGSNHSEAMRHLIADSVRKLLDCKKFLKNYECCKNLSPTQFINLSCHIELGNYPSPPPELLILRSDATVGHLKLEATKAFQEVYAILKRFQAEALLGYGPVDDSMNIRLLVGSCASVRVLGRCPGMQSLHHFCMERGTEIWTVDCVCGAKDDDGERMLACDTCGIWMHTRCVGVDNFESILFYIQSDAF